MRGAAEKPRIGALGAGWIGRDRLKAVAASGAAQIAAICDPSDEAVAEITADLPGAERLSSLADLLNADLDGVMIATPSAGHAEQARLFLEAGMAVFCQKPLGRDAAEVETVLTAAREADRLLAVDHSYR
ncbi:MAG TPA: Gfo/Idh/MocA family oxidoreductase, partial [Paracoccaceae bacterium]|nr:Gfo/Idh/MocA family oxidoreductase [Paracoccaceae bacterium]